MIEKNVVIDGFRCYNYPTQTETELHKMTTSQVAVANTERTTEDLTNALETLRQMMVNDYNRDGFTLGYNVEFEFRQKYIRLIHTDGKSKSGSCAGWICIERDNKKFAFGDLLKSAGRLGPAKNFARGNVFELEGKTIRWTGIQ